MLYRSTNWTGISNGRLFRWNTRRRLCRRIHRSKILISLMKRGRINLRAVSRISDVLGSSTIYFRTLLIRVKSRFHQCRTTTVDFIAIIANVQCCIEVQIGRAFHTEGFSVGTLVKDSTEESGIS